MKAITILEVSMIMAMERVDAVATAMDRKKQRRRLMTHL